MSVNKSLLINVCLIYNQKIAKNQIKSIDRKANNKTNDCFV